jgi:hypothetical protein
LDRNDIPPRTLSWPVLHRPHYKASLQETCGVSVAMLPYGLVARIRRRERRTHPDKALRKVRPLPTTAPSEWKRHRFYRPWARSNRARAYRCNARPREESCSVRPLSIPFAWACLETVPNPSPALAAPGIVRRRAPAAVRASRIRADRTRRPRQVTTLIARRRGKFLVAYRRIQLRFRSSSEHLASHPPQRGSSLPAW